MKRIIYVDMRLLEGLEIPDSVDPDPELVSKVNDALERLDPLLRDILKGRIYDGETIDSLAAKHGRPVNEIKRILYEAVRQMRIYLSDFVRARWGIETGKTCKVCRHSNKAKIEAILRRRRPGDSWKVVTQKIHKATGERFHPPQILKAHLKHMVKEEVGYDEEG